MQTTSGAILIAALLWFGGCDRPISQSDLRLEATYPDGRKSVKVTAPPQALKINPWIEACPGNVEVIYQSPRVASFACREPRRTRYASFRLLDGHHLRLADIIQEGAEQALAAACEKAFQKRKTAAAPIPDDIALNAQGLIFFANGIDVVIPQTELRPMVKPQSALLVGR